MKIRTRLILVNFLFIIAILSIFAIVYRYNQTNARFEQLVEKSFQVKTLMYKSHAHLQEVLTGSNVSRQYQRFTSTYEEFEQKVDELLSSSLYSRITAREDYADKYAASLREAMELNRSKIEELDTSIASLTTGGGSSSKLLQAHADADGRKRKELQEIISQIEFLSASFRDSFVFTVDQVASGIRSGAEAKLRNLLSTSIAISAAITFIVLLLSGLLVIRLRRQLDSLQHSMAGLSEGDFTQRFHEGERNELSALARSMNSFVTEFSAVIRDIKELARRNTTLHNQVSNATSESTSSIEDISEHLSDITSLAGNLVHHLERSSSEIENVTGNINSLTQRIEGQSSSVTQASSSVEEMTASIENVSTISERRREAADNLAEITAQTGEKLQETNRLIEENAGDVNQILEVINIINNVASQTNLLSMNAAIEAAHAGDAGRGFAVVAEEIRTLSETTNQNAKKIKTTINTIADRIGRINEMSGKTQEAFRHINEETTRSSESMAEISSSMQELAQGSREIMEAMNSLTHTTQDIQEGAERMQNSTHRVNESLQEIHSIGGKVNEDIQEIESETQEVSSSMSRINELNEENHVSIEHLFNAIRRFHTGEEHGSDTTEEQGEHAFHREEKADTEGNEVAEENRSEEEFPPN